MALFCIWQSLGRQSHSSRRLCWYRTLGPVCYRSDPFTELCLSYAENNFWYLLCRWFQRVYSCLRPDWKWQDLYHGESVGRTEVRVLHDLISTLTLLIFLPHISRMVGARSLVWVTALCTRYLSCWIWSNNMQLKLTNEFAVVVRVRIYCGLCSTTATDMCDVVSRRERLLRRRILYGGSRTGRAKRRDTKQGDVWQLEFFLLC